VIENQSGTHQLEVTSDELDEFERAGNPPIDSDVVDDQVMPQLLGFLEREGLLEDIQSLV
jgi:hypothetical protein